MKLRKFETEVKKMTTLEKEGKIISVDWDYLADDGRVFTRKYIGRRQNTVIWVNEEEGMAYKKLYDAYFRMHGIRIKK